MGYQLKVLGFYFCTFGEFDFSSDLAGRIDSDSLISRADVFKIIKEIHDLNLKWTEEEILGAWTKSRSAKSDKCSLQSREKVKLLKINQRFIII